MAFRLKHICPILKQTGLGLALILLITPFGIKGQNREALERDKQNIEREIRLINEMLQETKKTAEVSMNQLVMLNTQITRRESLMRAINNEISQISRRIDEQNNVIETLTHDLEELRESYANMVRYAYLTRSNYQRVAFLFSSRSFNQAYLRLRYLQEYARHRQLQAEKIVKTQQSLQEEITRLEEQKLEQERLREEQQNTMQDLNQEKTEQNQTITQLRQKESELMQRLREQERARQELQRSIERIIAEERRRSQEEARAAGRTVSPGTYALTPEEQLLSNNFAGNKGKLPWPVERGVITGTFGEHPHPVLRNNKIVNNGIDIASVPGSKARAIFDGTVSRVITIPGAYYAIIVRHGEYLTVYSNLSQVSVKNGDKVSIRQEIGTVATDTREGKTQIHLEIWRGNNKLNPADWIARQR
ncbi:MAG: peptidoglycan DD-metalloendopeptidase family protein [Bacteroidales bacterium]|jgi:septal ring factor EnvC (AmiA/AmiB activator)|nr:peptidoglycan DD-metalloendopeptidase family protein [Bacteroidales bacterium]NLM93123.1 peptidoglycan DD-metalloendopeptidase family protein [Bacteroidales bacterium]